MSKQNLVAATEQYNVHYCRSKSAVTSYALSISPTVSYAM